MVDDSHDLRVLQLDLARRWGGAERRVLEFSQHVAGVVTTFVVALEGSPLFTRARESTCPTIGIGRSRADPRLLPRLVRAIRQTDASTLDAHNRQSYFWGSLAAIRTGVGFVATVHHNYRAETGLRRLLDTLAIRLAARAGASFVAVSNDVGHALVETGIAPERIELIQAGLEIPPSTDVDRPTGEHRIDRLRVCSVGSLLPVKGHAVLLRALAILRADRSIECVIAGEGRERRSLERLAAQLGIDDLVRFVGFTPNIAAILHEADAFCLPSLSEGLPYAALEAVAAGVPTVMSSVGAIPDLFTHGATARLVPPKDARKLASELAWVHDHPAEAAAMASLARSEIRERLDITAMISNTLDLYSNLGLERPV